MAGSLADGVLAGIILIPPGPTVLPTNISKVRVHRKKVRKIVTQKRFTS